MRPTGQMTNFAPGNRGVERDPATLASHRFQGGRDSSFFAAAVTMATRFTTHGDTLRLTVEITNSGAGHYVPTGIPMRHMLLVVRVRTGDGADIPLIAGPVVPAWGGTGPAATDYAGRPGKVFAKLLEDAAGNAPVAFFEAAREGPDSRIAPRATDRSEYRFLLPASPLGTVAVDAALLYRRAWKAWSDAKGWNLPDQVVARWRGTIPRGKAAGGGAGPPAG